MMAQPAIALGLPLRLLAEAEGVSAAQVIPDHLVGDYRDLDTLREGDRRAARSSRSTTSTCPPSTCTPSRTPGSRSGPARTALVHAQDKGVMRARLAELDVPCPRNALVGSRGRRRGVRASRASSRRRGAGTTARASGSCPRPTSAPSRCAWPRRRGVRLLAEERVDFRRELSALVARSPSGQAAAYPVVASTQKDGICHEVVAPAPDLAPALAGQAQEIALRVAGALDVTGILAVELFETTDGRMLVNELAMRPAQHRPLDPGRRRHVAVREPPARGDGPAARVTGAAGAVDGDGQHPRRTRTRPAACTTGTRTRWPATRTCGCTSTARSCVRAARSATSTPTATTWTTAWSGRGTPPRGSAETWETRVSDPMSEPMSEPPPAWAS